MKNVEKIQKSVENVQSLRLGAETVLDLNQVYITGYELLCKISSGDN